MPDHLKLGQPVGLDSKRRPPGGADADAPPVDRHARATTLAGIMAGLESGGRQVFGDVLAGDDEVDDLGDIVLKFTTIGAPIKGPFSKLKMIALGENSDNEFYVLSGAESRELFSELVRAFDPNTSSSDWDKPQTWAKLLEQLQGVEIYGSDDRRDPSLVGLDFTTPRPVDVVLWPTSLLRDTSATRVAGERVEAIVEAVESASQRNPSVAVLTTDARPDTALVRAQVDEPLLNELLENPFVERIRGPLAPYVTASDLLTGTDPTVVPNADGALIGVIDDLVITANPLMRSVVRAQESFPTGGAFGGATSHGTFVASIAAYGSLDDAALGGTLPQPFPILAARVSEAGANGQPQVPGDVVSKFEQALEWLAANGARVAVIAFAYDHADLEPIPTELTVTLDRLARELKLVLVVSAGNLREVDAHWQSDYPSYLKAESSRVAAPGTSALAITVGATAHRDIASDTTLTAIAPIGATAPYSRTGPVRGNRQSRLRKPEVSGPGGNWGWGPVSSAPVIRDPGLGVVGLSTKNSPTFVVTSGTSAAAPYVAHEVARIATRYPEVGPNLLRALTALAAPPLREVPSPLDPAIGSAYGIPSAARILESGGNRAVMVFEGEIRAGGRVIHTLPIPKEFAASSTTERHLRIALAFDPPVKRSRRDYVAGRMNFDFVRNLAFEDVKRTWEVQPTVAQRAAGARYDKLPSGNERPQLFPGVNSVLSNTLIRRDIVTQTWNEDDETYFLVVSHDESPWTTGQLRAYPTQTYAIAIELVDVGRTTLDLHSLVEAELAAQARGQVRGRARR